VVLLDDEIVFLDVKVFKGALLVELIGLMHDKRHKAVGEK